MSAARPPEGAQRPLGGSESGLAMQGIASLTNALATAMARQARSAKGAPMTPEVPATP